MRVLIIGGTNFIGPPLVRRLTNLGHEVAVFHRGQTAAALPEGVLSIQGDRQRLGDHEPAFRRYAPEVVVDMIAYTEDHAQAAVSTFRDLAKRLVMITSADVYLAYGKFIGIEPGTVEPLPLTEESPLRTVLFPYRGQAKGPDDFLYSYDKIPVERVVMTDQRLPATILRLPMTYGPGDPFRRLSLYLMRMEAGHSTIVMDEGIAAWKSPRGFVDDVAAAIALAVVDERAIGRIYNIGQADAYTERAWAERIGRLIGWHGTIETVPRGQIPVPYRTEQSLVTDTSRIRRELGFTETITLDESLTRTIAWEHAHPPASAPGIGLADGPAAEARPS